MKEVKITKERFSVRDVSNEDDWYYCPECECDSIMRGDNFCCNCGAKIKWDLK